MNVMAKTKKVVSPQRDPLLAPEANFLVRTLSLENAAIETRPQLTIGLHDARVVVHAGPPANLYRVRAPGGLIRVFAWHWLDLYRGADGLGQSVEDIGPQRRGAFEEITEQEYA